MDKAPQTYMEVLTGGFCQYISGDPKNKPTFCGNKSQPESPYCPEHHKLCRTPPPEMKRDLDKIR